MDAGVGGGDDDLGGRTTGAADGGLGAPPLGGDHEIGSESAPGRPVSGRADRRDAGPVVGSQGALGECRTVDRRLIQAPGEAVPGPVGVDAEADWQARGRAGASARRADGDAVDVEAQRRAVVGEGDEVIVAIGVGAGARHADRGCGGTDRGAQCARGEAGECPLVVVAATAPDDHRLSACATGELGPDLDGDRGERPGPGRTHDHAVIATDRDRPVGVTGDGARGADQRVANVGAVAASDLVDRGRAAGLAEAVVGDRAIGGDRIAVARRYVVTRPLEARVSREWWGGAGCPLDPDEEGAGRIHDQVLGGDGGGGHRDGGAGWRITSRSGDEVSAGPAGGGDAIDLVEAVRVGQRRLTGAGDRHRGAGNRQPGRSVGDHADDPPGRNAAPIDRARINRITLGDTGPGGLDGEDPEGRGDPLREP